MKNILPLLLFTFLLASCNKKTVLLPETTNADITKVLDVSPVYLFYDEIQPDSIEFNRKNMISTTNWLVNIDKRLTLKQILPHLQYLQDKRHGDGMHTNKNAKNYFTCSNPEIENLAFIEFTNTLFHIDNSLEFYLNKLDSLESKYFILNINSKSEVEIINLQDRLMTHEFTIDSLLNNIKEFAKNESIRLCLQINGNLSFQDYVSVKTLLLEMNEENIEVNKNEFIYN